MTNYDYEFFLACLHFLSLYEPFSRSHNIYKLIFYICDVAKMLAITSDVFDDYFREFVLSMTVGIFSFEYTVCDMFNFPRFYFSIQFFSQQELSLSKESGANFSAKTFKKKDLYFLNH